MSKESKTQGRAWAAAEGLREEAELLAEELAYGGPLAPETLQECLNGVETLEDRLRELRAHLASLATEIL